MSGIVLVDLRKAIMVKYFNVASVALLSYDTVLNVGDEVIFIWGSRWNFGTWLYLATRYLAFVDMSAMLLYLFRDIMDVQTCRTVYATSAYFAFIGAVIAEIILTMRTYALWYKSRLVLVILILLDLSLLIPAAWITYMSVNALEFISSPFPTLVPCLPTVPMTKEFISIAGVMILEALMTILAVLSAVNHWRHTKNPLIRTLYRDGVFYFKA